MSKDPWLQAINAFEPSTPLLKTALENGPKIKINIHKIKKSWVVHIKDTWSEPLAFIPFNHIDLKKCIDWSQSQLSSWKTCKRTSYDKWQFSSKKDAEKFITMFNIVWPQ